MRASVHVDLPGWTKESVDKLRLAARSSTCSPAVPVESPVVRLATPTTSPTSTDWDTPRSSWSRSRLTPSTPSGRRIWSSRRSTACKEQQPTNRPADNSLFSDSLGLFRFGLRCPNCLLGAHLNSVLKLFFNPRL